MKVQEITPEPQPRLFQLTVTERELRYLEAVVGHIPNESSRKHPDGGEYGFDDVSTEVFDVLDKAVDEL